MIELIFMPKGGWISKKYPFPQKNNEKKYKKSGKRASF
jgi:hypothetical protein